MLWSRGIDSKEPIPLANVTWACICKRLRSPGIDFKEPIPLSNVAWACICKCLRRARNRARNRFLGSIKVLKIPPLFVLLRSSSFFCFDLAYFWNKPSSLHSIFRICGINRFPFWIKQTHHHLEGEMGGNVNTCVCAVVSRILALCNTRLNLKRLRSASFYPICGINRVRSVSFFRICGINRLRFASLQSVQFV